MAETEELPGSVEGNSPIHGNGEGAENEGVPPEEAEPSAPPPKLPPINGSNDGDGLEGYRQNLNGIEVSSPGGSDEVILKIRVKILKFVYALQKCQFFWGTFLSNLTTSCSNIFGISDSTI